MKKRLYVISLTTLFINVSLSIFCQSREDSVMLANSEKWQFEFRKGMFTLSSKSTDTVITMTLSKLDSGTSKRKTRDSSFLEFSGSGGFDQSKYVTIRKVKTYRLQRGNDVNATTAAFSTSSVSNEQRQTFLGKMISKSDENRDEVLNYKRTIAGIIKRTNNMATWEFKLEDMDNNLSNQGLPFIKVPTVSGFLKTGQDSMFFQPSIFGANVILTNADGEHLAASAFRKKPYTIWIRRDIDNSLQDAIAVLFAVIISMKR